MNNYDKEKLRELINNPLFRAANADLCKKFEREEKELAAEKKIREYLQEHPGVSFVELIAKTQVEMRVVEDLIAAGRIKVKISSADREHLEEIQREKIANLSKLSNAISESQTQKRVVQEEEHKASGMYSSKEKLGTDRTTRR